jgi:lipopolysaccharide export system protein LptA
MSKVTPNINNEEINNNSNIIKDLFYTSKDLKGNEYSIYAKEGEIDLDNNNIIFMSNVTAYIKLKKKSETVTITSNYGKYNSLNYDTIFSKNVKVEYIDNVITGEYLDFSLIKNLLMISRNVIYKSPKNIMMADVIEMDIKTKDTKIFMYNSEEKVNLKNYN